jgi:two-component system, chemotaxis family, chemotaxis protein CheY
MKHDILVIENDEALGWLLENILKDRFRVVITKDTLSAMSRMANGNLPSLILCDFDLPGINGLSFLKNLTNSGAFTDIPVIMFASSPDDKTSDKCIKAGASGFVKKPFDPLKLIEEINKVLKGNEKTVA